MLTCFKVCIPCCFFGPRLETERNYRISPIPSVRLLKRWWGWWELMRADESWWGLMRTNARWWELMRADGSWLELMRGDGRWWELMRGDEGCWEVMGGDESWWELMGANERWWEATWTGIFGPRLKTEWPIKSVPSVNLSISYHFLLETLHYLVF
jgi:hypothetical protein